MSIKPRVLIMIAADEISGPAKGVLQFLEHAPSGAFEYVVCNFDRENHPVGQFVKEARRRKLNLRLLRQRRSLDPAMIFEARRVVQEHDINLIQTHGYKSNTIGFFLRLLCRRPWMGFAHGYISDSATNRFYNRIDRLVLRQADRVVAVSHALKGLLTRHGVAAHRIRVVHNAIEASAAAPSTSAREVRLRHGVAPGEKLIGVIGRLNPEKGQLVFLKAMERTIRHVPDVKALIIGDGQDRSTLERFCRERGLAPRVLFLGFQENIADYYQVLDLLVQPSFSEGLPNTVLEAMSFGVPVLATAVGGVPEVIQDGNGVMVPPNDPDSLAERLIELLSDGARRQAIGARGRESLHPRFASDHRARQIIGLYQELLARM
jgi:glycosyltransferase involved in cell wall biosynthesis